MCWRKWNFWRPVELSKAIRLNSRFVRNKFFHIILMTRKSKVNSHKHDAAQKMHACNESLALSWLLPFVRLLGFAWSRMLMHSETRSQEQPVAIPRARFVCFRFEAIWILDWFRRGQWKCTGATFCLWGFNEAFLPWQYSVRKSKTDVSVQRIRPESRKINHQGP